MPEEADRLDVETVENYGSGHDFAARGSLNVFLFRISAVLLLVRELQKSTIQKRFSFDEWTKWITKITVPPFVSNWSTSNAGCKFSSRSSNSKERHMAVGDLRHCPWILPSFEKYGKEAALRNNSCNMVARSNPCGDNVI